MYKFPKHNGLDCTNLTELETLLNSKKDVDGVTKFPNQSKTFRCGQLLLKHININNLQGGFCVIQIMNLNRSYIYGGATQNLNVWRTIMKLTSDCLPNQAYLGRISLGIAIHFWGEDIEEDFKTTLKQIRDELLFFEDKEFTNETSIHIPIVTRFGYLIYPDDCGLQKSFVPITTYAAMTSADIEPIDKNSIFRRYNDNLLKEVQKRLDTEKKLMSAILNYEFELFYQPVVDLLTHKIVSAESLIRWTSSGLSNNKIFEYIPIIEKSKYIIDFTEHTFIALVTFIQANKHLFPEDFKISFNLSQAVFKWDEFNLLEMIKNGMKIATNLSSFLIIEITESAYFSKSISNKVISTLTLIKELGIEIAIDDFGSGYGALKLISSNIANIIKLDRELTQEICNQRSESNFLKSLIYAASLSNFKIIAEGIENNGQHSLMLFYGIRYGQGYNFHKPMSEATFLKLF